MTDSTALTKPDVPAEQVLDRYQANSLPAMMAQHHPINGIFGAAFEEVGGFNRLTEWIREDSKNYYDFLRIFAKMAPPPQADVTVKQMNITVNGKLRPTPLDGELES